MENEKGATKKSDSVSSNVPFNQHSFVVECIILIKKFTYISVPLNYTKNDIYDLIFINNHS